jgi:prophage regulatory protein
MDKKSPSRTSRDVAAPHRRFVRFSQLKPEYGIGWSRMHIDRLGRAGKFPAKVHLGPNTIGWWSDEIEAFLEARSAERTEPIEPRSVI